MSTNNTTSNNDILRELGLNPGSLDYHFNVSLEPIRFRHIESLGWGEKWQAIHSCNLERSDGPEGIVFGMEFNAKKSQNTYRKLLAVWEENYLENYIDEVSN